MVMPVIRPSSNSRNKYNEISEFCHRYAEPVYITKIRKGDLAVMSIELYEKLTGKLELYKLLDEGIEDLKNNRMMAAEEAFSYLEGEDKVK